MHLQLQAVRLEEYITSGRGRSYIAWGKERAMQLQKQRMRTPWYNKKMQGLMVRVWEVWDPKGTGVMMRR